MVTAAEQSAGRGRRGRVWSAPAGRALLYSAILRPLGLEHALLPLASRSRSARRSSRWRTFEARIKWPNDVWIDEAKVAGVLIEARPPEWAVIGIGVNVAIEADEFPADLRWPATSIGGTASRSRRCATRSRRRSPNGSTRPRSGRSPSSAAATRSPVARSAGRGPGSIPAIGVAAGIDERGNLLVDTPAGERLALGSGEVSLRLAG